MTSTARTSAPQRRPAPQPASPPPWIAGPQWGTLRLRQPGWLLLPLRGFLAVTFIYAALQKLANPAYLKASNPTSVVGQMTTLRHTSPIGPLLALSMHAPTLVGLLIAFGELAVGVGILVGLWTRLAAVGGMVLSLTFFLTVSWSTTPYYYGSDIVFFFAWSVFALTGAGGVLSVDGWIASRARQLSGLPPTPATVTVDLDRLRAVCSRDAKCGLNPATGCTHRECPLLPKGPPGRGVTEPDLQRRRVLLGARAAVMVGVGALGLGGATALLGRLAGGSSANAGGLAGAGPGQRHRTPKPSPSNPGPVVKSHAPGVAIGSASAVPVGQAGRFTDPGSGGPAWLVHTSANTFVAFSATCTHAGCPVSFEPSSMEFVCPCHGGTFDAKTGQVLGGPPPTPLPSIPVHVVNGTIRVD